MKKRIPAVILMFALFIGSALAVNAYQKSITVKYGITVEFNGQELSMTDADGIPVDAFVYEGTTYVPIRAISETFGADVGYDASTNTAYVYDDFTEIITAAYKLNRTIAHCDSLLSLFDTAIGYTFNEKPYNYIVSAFRYTSRDQDMLDLLSKENCNYSILEDNLLSAYNKYLSYYDESVEEFIKMYNTNNFNNSTDYMRSRYLARSARIEYETTLENVLDSYNWRTFDIE